MMMRERIVFTLVGRLNRLSVDRISRQQKRRHLSRPRPAAKQSASQRQAQGSKNRLLKSRQRRRLNQPPRRHRKRNPSKDQQRHRNLLPKLKLSDRHPYVILVDADPRCDDRRHAHPTPPPAKHRRRNHHPSSPSPKSDHAWSSRLTTAR